MKTLVLEKPKSFVLDETPEPATIKDNEALVRVIRVGVCGTDIHAFEGTQPFFSYPRILGHELAVEVLALGKADHPHKIQVGDICAVEPYLNCGQCIACRRGSPNACVRLLVLGVHIDGGMRERIVVPIHKLHPANHLSVEQIAMVEMLSVGAHAVRRANLTAGENVLVIGAGPIGLGVMCFAQMAGVRVIAVDVNPDRLEFCQRALGIQDTLDARHNVLSPAQKLLDGEMPTAVFDATGNIGSMNQAFRYVANSGRLIFVGLTQEYITVHNPHFHRNELTLLASRNATPEDFRQVIDALGTGQVNIQGWVTHHSTPEDLPHQFPDWLKPTSGLIKAVLEF